MPTKFERQGTIMQLVQHQVPDVRGGGVYERIFSGASEHKLKHYIVGKQYVRRIRTDFSFF